MLTRDASTDRWKWSPPAGAKYSGRRRTLANWLTDTEQGGGTLMARVTANRVWQQHFGRGIVATPNDFGKTGALPSHPELLDWLAGELVRGGWKLKPMHRLLMTSAAYKQSSTADAAKTAADLENTLFMRRIPRRLEGEAVRDSALAVSGVLDPTMFGAGTLDENSVRRSIYFRIKRSQLVNSMVVFDAPDASVTCTRRTRSNTPLQALTQLNDSGAAEWAMALSKRVVKESNADDGSRLRTTYQLALSRQPRTDEAERMMRFIKTQKDSGRDPWQAVARILFNLDEFLTRP